MTVPRLAVDGPRGRVYPVPDSSNEIQLLPSVSTVLKQLRNPWLEEWGRRETVRTILESEELLELARRDVIRAVQEAEPKPGAAAALGTAIHLAIEQRHEERPSVEMEPYVAAYERLLDVLEAREFAQEVTVYSHQWGYAGTADGVWEVPGLGRIVIDIKTGAMYDSYRWQLAGYANAEGIWDGQKRRSWDVNSKVGALLNIKRPDAPRIVFIDLERAWPVMRTLAQLRQEIDRER